MSLVQVPATEALETSRANQSQRLVERLHSFSREVDRLVTKGSGLLHETLRQLDGGKSGEDVALLGPVIHGPQPLNRFLEDSARVFEAPFVKAQGCDVRKGEPLHLRIWGAPVQLERFLVSLLGFFRTPEGMLHGSDAVKGASLPNRVPILPLAFQQTFIGLPRSNKVPLTAIQVRQAPS